ncbi:7-cyano-7-deazaguanine synthase [Candidatus Woesearchaeota archaeon]|nr:7-cyano-7-deazaguanine synthase [Candidatus Woesearchaeota archaeon]
MIKKKALLLLSGGFDSPVAGYLMKTQGLEIIALHFSLEPFTDNSAEIKSKKIAKHLGIKKFITITNGQQQAELTKKCDHRFYYILQRRLYLRIAEIIAKKNPENIFGKQGKEGTEEKEGCAYLITGDNIGQVGSQTLKNMEVITRAVNLPILRPVLCNDKNETIDFAKKIGTYELSVGPEMCSVLGPKHPATTSTLEKVENEERKVDINQLIEGSLKTMKIESL